MTELGTMEELPGRYIDELAAIDMVPLWPLLRGFLPRGMPDRQAKPAHWSYASIRPLLLEAGELTPIEKAERRVLVLCNPGYDANEALITPTIYAGLQLILPGETAPNHKHTPSAIRLVVEGDGGYTTVEGERLPMEPGDLILTPPGMWHEHGHSGNGPLVWMDALDLPLIYRMEASYVIEGGPQPARQEPDNSQTRFRRAGVVPYRSLSERDSPYPLLRFPWTEVRAALGDLAHVTPHGEAVQLAYVNPQTGQECLAVMGFSALMLRAGEELTLRRRSASSVLKVVDGDGTAEIDGESFTFTQHDIMAVPTHARVRLQNQSSRAPAYLFVVDDAPLQRKVGIYEEFD